MNISRHHIQPAHGTIWNQHQAKVKPIFRHFTELKVTLFESFFILRNVFNLCAFNSYEFLVNSLFNKINWKVDLSLWNCRLFVKKRWYLNFFVFVFLAQWKRAGAFRFGVSFAFRFEYLRTSVLGKRDLGIKLVYWIFTHWHCRYRRNHFSPHGKLKRQSIVVSSVRDAAHNPWQQGISLAQWCAVRNFWHAGALDTKLRLALLQGRRQKNLLAFFPAPFFSFFHLPVRIIWSFFVDPTKCTISTVQIYSYSYSSPFFVLTAFVFLLAYQLYAYISPKMGYVFFRKQISVFFVSDLLGMPKSCFFLAK